MNEKSKDQIRSIPYTKTTDKMIGADDNYQKSPIKKRVVVKHRMRGVAANKPRTANKDYSQKDTISNFERQTNQSQR